ncbi:MAG TPA: hypothetical protein VGJ30_00430 [Candidatus Angelobacter sp.]|jgi:hypothetical protein
MSIQRSEKVLLVALTVFAISFFLPAIWIPHVTQHTATGYWCAYVTLVSPWTSDGMRDLATAPVQYFAILLSGWINPLFLISMVLSRREKTRRFSRTLRTVVLFLMPACWVVFFTEHVYPFAGYLIWTVAIIAALFSSSFSEGSLSSNQQERGAGAGA